MRAGWLAALTVACSGTGPVDLTEPTVIDPALPELVSSTSCAACDGDCVVEVLRYASRQHTTAPIDYPDPPPAGGDHNPCWAPFGVHEIAVEDDRFVHNLEHGGVVFLYGCDDCVAEVSAMVTLTQDKAPFALLTPYSALPTRFAAVAWEVRMLAGCFEPEAFGAFYDAHVDEAPESIASGPSASCM